MNRIFILSICLLFSLTSFSQKDLSLEDAVMKQWTDFYPESIDQLQWMPKGTNYSFVEDNILKKGNNGKNSDLLSLKEFNRYADRTDEALPSIDWETENSFTFKKTEGVFRYHIKEKKLTSLLRWDGESAYGDLNKQMTRSAFTSGNDLIILTAHKRIQVTKNEKNIVSGQAFARQEFGIVKGTFWSPDGEKLAFYQKDESNVTEYPLVQYNTTPASVKMIKYPMAGSSSEIPSVGVYNCTTGETVFLNLENGKKDDSFYATNLGWDPDNEHIYLAIVQRDQKEIWLKKYNVKSGREVGTLLHEKNERYVEPEHAPIFVPGTNKFLWFSERNGFDNLYLYNQMGEVLKSTEFKFPITSFLKFSSDNKSFFITATGENPTHNHLYKISLSNFKATKVTSEHGQHRAQVSDDGKYVLDRYSNLNTPNVISLMPISGKKGKELFRAKDPLNGYIIGKTEIFSMKSFDGTELWCRMIKPSNFDESKKYPVLVYVYNGPHVQLVKDQYLGGASLWMHYLAEQGYIVFTVDGRGSKNRGFDFESSIHRRVGEMEVKDQEHCAKWLKDQPYTDETRFAVHGWSYGGFMTTSLMLKRPGLFEVGVGGGPVIDWKYYEVMYTERYMDTPQSNPEGFDKANLTNYVENLEGDLLLIHGAIDDVVVMQHNMAFQKACIDKGVQVDFYAYPGHPHNVRGKDRVHLMRKVLDYVMENN